jgi:hypothetical protein
MKRMKFNNTQKYKAKILLRKGKPYFIKQAINNK